MGHPDFDNDILMQNVKVMYALTPTMEVNGGPELILDDDFDKINQVEYLESCLNQFARAGRNDRVRIDEFRLKKLLSRRVMDLDSCVVMSAQLSKLFAYWEVGAPNFRRSLGDVTYSPVIELFLELVDDWSQKHPVEPKTSDTTLWLDYFRAKVFWRNSLLDALYSALASRGFLEEQTKNRRSSRKNYQSACEYVDNLITRRSKVLVLRFDLAYRKYRVDIDMSRLQSSDGVTPERALLDREQFIKLLKKKFADSWLGYIWKLEYRPRKGYHYHMLVFLDGHKNMFDHGLIDQAGKLWINDITQGVGVYFNCNKSASRYLSDGTGMLLRTDNDKIMALKKAVGYLTKIDVLIKSRLLIKRRTFGKGEMVLSTKRAEVGCQGRFGRAVVGSETKVDDAATRPGAVHLPSGRNLQIGQ